MSSEREQKMLPVKSDVLFRLFFADERNEEFLVSFLKSVLSIPEEEYGEVEIVDPRLLGEKPGDKQAVVDVKLRTKSGRIVHIEIQLQVMPELAKRIVFYAASLVAEQIKSGEGYDVIHSVASIVILDESLVKANDRYHHRFALCDVGAGVELTDVLEVHTLELGKLPESPDGTELYDWAKFIDAESDEELSAVGDRNQEVGKAVIKYRELTADERVREEHFRREKMRRDMDMRVRYERRLGIEEGVEALFMEGDTTSQGAVKGLMRLGLEAKAAEELVQKWEAKKKKDK